MTDEQAKELVEEALPQILELDIGNFTLSKESRAEVSELLALDNWGKSDLLKIRNAYIEQYFDYVTENTHVIDDAQHIFAVTKYVTAPTSVIDRYLGEFEESRHYI